MHHPTRPHIHRGRQTVHDIEITGQQFLSVLLSLCFFAGVAVAAPLKGAVYSPKAGVLCDKKAGFCADSEGISMALTKLYLGDKAEEKMMDMIKEVGLENFDATTFTLTNGVHCETK